MAKDIKVDPIFDMESDFEKHIKLLKTLNNEFKLNININKNKFFITNNIYIDRWEITNNHNEIISSIRDEQIKEIMALIEGIMIGLKFSDIISNDKIKTYHDNGCEFVKVENREPFENKWYYETVCTYCFNEVQFSADISAELNDYIKVKVTKETGDATEIFNDRVYNKFIIKRLEKASLNYELDIKLKAFNDNIENEKE